jgi:hypothetical protein
MTNKLDKMSLLLLNPAFALSVLAKIGCPLCWAVQVGGANFALSAYFAASPYFMPMAVFTLSTSWIILARAPKKRERFGRLAIATIACILILSGKTVSRPRWRIYTGGTAFVAASVWSQWHRKPVIYRH